MAEDTRKPDETSSKDIAGTEEVPPWRKKSNDELPKSQAGKMWEAFGNPADSPNQMPGGMYNSAGGKPRDLTWKDAFSFRLSEITTFYKLPCARDALLVGMGGGAAVGSVTAVFGGMSTRYALSLTEFLSAI